MKKKNTFLVTAEILLTALACGAIVQAQHESSRSGDSTSTTTTAPNPSVADPGVRAGSVGAGSPVVGLSADQMCFFKTDSRDLSKSIR